MYRKAELELLVKPFLNFLPAIQREVVEIEEVHLLSKPLMDLRVPNISICCDEGLWSLLSDGSSSEGIVHAAKSIDYIAR